MKEWFGDGGLINKYPVLNSIHKFMIFSSPVWAVFTGEAYSPSWIFFLLLIFWIWMVINSYNLISTGFEINGWLAFVIGILVSTVLAQIGLYRVILMTIGTFLFREDTWMYRMIVFVVVIFLFVVLDYSSRMLSRYLKQVKKKAKKEDLEFNEEKVKKFMEGVEEGSKAGDKA